MVTVDEKTALKAVNEALVKAVQFDEIAHAIEMYFAENTNLLVKMVAQGTGVKVYSMFRETGKKQGREWFQSASEAMFYILKLAAEMKAEHANSIE